MPGGSRPDFPHGRFLAGSLPLRQCGPPFVLLLSFPMPGGIHPAPAFQAGSGLPDIRDLPCMMPEICNATALRRMLCISCLLLADCLLLL
jgi:hypothetical protein